MDLQEIPTGFFDDDFQPTAVDVAGVPIEGEIIALRELQVPDATATALARDHEVPAADDADLVELTS
ncbi:MAG: hypothetical protein JO116_18645, partial [Planctomycetaceae bacterium]|nr:hypothetical protein [Planctomycetaceae bacterium]